MTTYKIEETFKHINEYWTEEEYKKCYIEWEEIKKYIITNSHNNDSKCEKFICNNCNTIWCDKKFIYESICCACDTHCQPYLCNPINYKSILKYINPIWHNYLLPLDIHYCQSCYTFNLPKDNYCDYCDKSYCDNCLPDEISFHKCDSCGRKWCYYNGKHIDNICSKIGIHSEHCEECGL